MTIVDTSGTMTAARQLRRLGIGLLFVLGAVGSLGLYGVAVQGWNEAHDFIATTEPPGELIEVGKHRMHLDCVGVAQGDPTVILESGIGMSSRVWGLVQPALSDMTRVCSYDRLGHGWSSSAPSKRTGRQIAEELWSLLDAAGEPGAFLLVGHSAGGLYVRAAQALRPDAVVGLVLVDPSHEEMKETLSDPGQFARWAKSMRQTAFGLRYGLAHLPGMSGPPTLPVDEYPSPEPQVFTASLSRPAFLSAMARELEELTEESSEFARAHGEMLSSLPLVVISRSPLWSYAGPTRKEPTAENLAWTEAHARLASRSRLGLHVTAEVAGHDVHVDQPELVVEAVRGLLKRGAEA